MPDCLICGAEGARNGVFRRPEKRRDSKIPQDGNLCGECLEKYRGNNVESRCPKQDCTGQADYFVQKPTTSPMERHASTVEYPLFCEDCSPLDS